MKENLKLKGTAVIHMVFLQSVIAIYTLATVMAKFATQHEFLSLAFLGFYALEIIILALYAFLWQQAIKHFELSVAYANRAVALLWSLIWATLFFGEIITIKNMIGVMIVIAGTVIVNLDE